MRQERRTRLYGWGLFLPAAIFLAGFTYYPMLSTFFDSFFTTGQASRPSIFVGLGQYQDMADDPIFWQALRNNALFALGTIPTSIGLALLMAIWVNGKIRGRSLLRMAYFTPTVLPMIAA